ncbi:MAG TPA: heavy-metal-associated domain-containing protein [Bacillota bacterium]|nr:heavy-metal-associated domain-containing protein [Bacillota bacterium]
MMKAIFELEPLACPSCVNKIETALNRTEGVETTKVLFNSGKVRVDFDEGKTKTEDLAKIIEGLGYPVLDTKVS